LGVAHFPLVPVQGSTSDVPLYPIKPSISKPVLLSTSSLLKFPLYHRFFLRGTAHGPPPPNTPIGLPRLLRACQPFVAFKPRNLDPLALPHLSFNHCPFCGHPLFFIVPAPDLLCWPVSSSVFPPKYTPFLNFLVGGALFRVFPGEANRRQSHLRVPQWSPLRPLYSHLNI